MTFTGGIGKFFGKIIRKIVEILALSRIHPNVLTFIGLVINIWAAVLFAAPHALTVLDRDSACGLLKSHDDEYSGYRQNDERDHIETCILVLGQHA